MCRGLPGFTLCMQTFGGRPEHCSIAITLKFALAAPVCMLAPWLLRLRGQGASCLLIGFFLVVLGCDFGACLEPKLSENPYMLFLNVH